MDFNLNWCIYMSQKVSERAAAKKIKDKWKAKSWYKILTPESLGLKEIAETPAETPEQVMGRVAETTLYNINGDIKKEYVKLYFKVNKIDGNQAFTHFIGHDVTQDYIRRLVRRRRSRIDAIFPVTTSDGYTIRVKITAIADKRINSSLKSAIRKKIIEAVLNNGTKMNFYEFVNYMLSDKIVQDIEKNVKSVYNIKKIEVRKSNLLSIPSQTQLT
ncbi:MAG: 30S ribosomal protein S3ae [Euryarchaeota archaeon]|jgi:Ribosomal protein S3AE|nr:30S ribosomal protein S3ae [Euryarchaeota archaeon]MVT14146.1 30S ribosomal protein S3ae [Euryarchaeota archaeon]MVT35506.1 30S ribosomal protein S3ae [Euryarchaeota archaeon]